MNIHTDRLLRPHETQRPLTSEVCTRTSKSPGSMPATTLYNSLESNSLVSVAEDAAELKQKKQKNTQKARKVAKFICETRSYCRYDRIQTRIVCAFPHLSATFFVRSQRKYDAMITEIRKHHLRHAAAAVAHPPLVLKSNHNQITQQNNCASQNTQDTGPYHSNQPTYPRHFSSLKTLLNLSTEYHTFFCIQ